MPDMLFTIVCRAYEVEAKRRATPVAKSKAPAPIVELD
jgi:hypothetical protein